jgi:peptide/nickel transport system substrate-binding protein
MKRTFLVVSILVVVSMLAVACGPTPEPQVVEKIVTQEVEKVVTQEVEKVVTQEVEKVVTQEVVVTKEVEKVVTPVPEPLTEREQTLIMTYPFEPSQIDPHAYFEAEVNMPYNAVYESLYDMWGPDGEFTPRLAESYEYSADGLTLTFKLRQGVKFHSGEDFDAQTAKWNFDRIMSLNLSPAGNLVRYIDSVEAVDDYTLALHLKNPTPGYHMLFAGNWSMRFVCPAAVEEHKTADDPWAHGWFQDHMCGTGPYQFVSYEHGQQLTIERFPDYWGGWDGSHFETMIERIVPESSTQRMLLSGAETDLTCMPLELEDVLALQQQKGITCRSDPTTLIYIISVKSINAGDTGPIMSNVKVRQALAYAFNYDAVLENIMGLKGSRISDMLFTPGMEGYDPDHFVYTYDLDKAKQLLAEAGYPDGGFDLDLMWLEGFPDYPRIAEMYQADLAKLGINLTIHGDPAATFLDRIASPDTTPDLVLRPRAPATITWLWIEGWTKVRFPPDGLNEGYYTNDQFEELYKSATTEMDNAKRAEMIRQAAAIASDEVPVIWIAAVNDVLCFTDTLSGQVHSPWYMYVYWPYDLFRER